MFGHLWYLRLALEGLEHLDIAPWLSHRIDTFALEE